MNPICRAVDFVAFFKMHPPLHSVCWDGETFHNKKILKYAKSLSQGMLLALTIALRIFA